MKLLNINQKAEILNQSVSVQKGNMKGIFYVAKGLKFQYVELKRGK